jgi:hypothetical protein
VNWLQGGPGGSSLFGLFVEHGPFSVTKEYSCNLNIFINLFQKNLQIFIAFQSYKSLSFFAFTSLQLNL